MIEKISMRNFKCFVSLDLDLKPLNVLAGLNGMGKSTVIQSLLVLRQSYGGKELSELRLNGKYVELGNGRDILYERADDEEIEFGITDNSEDLQVRYHYYPDQDVLPRSYISRQSFDFEKSTLFGANMVFLSAYRIKPQKVYNLTYENYIEHRDFGNTGEYAIQYLKLYGSNPISNDAVLFDDCERSLYVQTKKWMSLIAPGVIPRVSIDYDRRNAELRFAFTDEQERSNEYKNINVGFGITYVLPLIVAILSAQPGDILLIESPEAHLHPAGQRYMGELISLAATGGIQVIVETHSDHVINGIRLAVKHGKISPDKTGIFFFSQAEDFTCRKVTIPVIDTNGKLDIWPKGFMDEWDNALLELLE